MVLAALVCLPFAIKKHFYSKGEAVTVEIPYGTSAAKIASILKDHGVIKSPLYLRICLKLSGAAPLLRSGVFQLNKNMPSEKVIWLLINGSGVVLEKVVIPEGWRIEEIDEELRKKGIIAAQGAFARAAKEQNLEGRLFPSTYFLRANMRPSEIIKMMSDEYDKNIAPLLAKRKDGSLSETQLLTLASIVEREAARDDERPKIAAVYLNRVNAGKKLEADPTVQYALGYSKAEQKYWKKGLTHKDLKYDSPYNTYLYGGLPPGPIANPGVSSVLAVLKPADTNDFFFVADEGAQGGHIFSATYNEHIQNIRNIRAKRR